MSVCFFFVCVFAEAAGCVLITLNEQMIQLMLPTKNATAGKTERDASGTDGEEILLSVFSPFVGFSFFLSVFICFDPFNFLSVDFCLTSAFFPSVFHVCCVQRHFTAKLSSIPVPLYESDTHTHAHTYPICTAELLTLKPGLDPQTHPWICANKHMSMSPR